MYTTWVENYDRIGLFMRELKWTPCRWTSFLRAVLSRIPKGGDTRVSGPGCRMRRGNGVLVVVEACVEAMRDLYTFSFASYNL